MNKSLILWIVLVIVGSSLAGCGAKVTPTAIPQATPPAVSVVAEGHIVPVSDLTLFFSARGRVAEVLVSRGDEVVTGQVLARLGDQQAVKASLAQAHLELSSAQQKYDELQRTVDLVHSQAWLAYLQAQQARAVAERIWEKLNLEAIEDDISDAQATVNAREADLDDARKEFDKYKDLDVNNTSRKNADQELTTAQHNYNESLRKLDEAMAKRDLPQATLAVALAAETEAKRKFDLTKTGSDPDLLELAFNRLEAAKAVVEASQAALDGYELKAPFAGTIADSNLKVGKLMGPETWAFILADFNELLVETSDLSELDVVKVTLGQAVQVTSDALQGLLMDGVVEEIAQTPKNQSGDITYTVRIRLKMMGPLLRWGMTVEVVFP